MNYNQLIKKILKDFNLGEVKDSRRLETSGNIAYQITTNTGKCFLRLSLDDPMRGRNRAELLAEIELIEYLFKNGLPVLVPIDNKIISVNGMNGYIRKYDDGDATDNPTVEQVRAVGQLLGKIHKVSRGYKTKHSREHIWDLAITKQHLLEDKAIIEDGFNGGQKFFSELQSSLFAIDEPTGLPRGMIHEDLGKRHVLWQNDQISAVIDFDRCYCGYLVDDLGQAVRGWCFGKNDDFLNINYQAFLHGYNDERELTKNELITLPQSIKFAFLERALSFALRGIAQKDDKLIEFAKRLLKNADKIDFIFDKTNQ